MSAQDRPLFERYLLRESFIWALVKKVLGLVCYACCVVSGFLAMAANDSLRRVGGGEDIGGPLGALAIVTAGVAGVGIFSAFGTRLIARSGVTILHWSRKPPLVYLRSFGTDTHWIDNWTDIFWILFFGPRFETYEWSLAKAVRTYGPLVAIGKPGEMLPPLGAARIYVEGAHWQEVVQDLAARAQLIILRAGHTEGFWWEVKHLVATTDPRRVVIYLPPKDRYTMYLYLRDQAAGILPHPLPEFAGDAFFLGFGSQWEPVLLGGQGPSMTNMARQILIGSPAPAVREALNPALAAIGVPTRPLPLQFREWVLVLCATFLFLLGWVFVLAMVMIATK